MEERIVRLSLFSTAAAFALVCFLWPHDAYAWGPLAHLEFSRSALSDLSFLGPALRTLLTNFANEFLYGSLAADIIVGKNLARYEVHCHNWKIGFRVFDQAKSDPQRAFSLGFLSHLAVDTIAHNYYVPYKTVQGFRARASGHAYWELRYDQRLDPDLWRLARQVSQKQYREHDAHLEEVLADSYVIPFALSKTMFGSLLLAARLKKWQRMSEVIAGERELWLHDEEIGECRNLAVQNIRDMLKHAQRARCVEVDPTGERNLHIAGLLRNQLKARDDLSERQQAEIVRQARPAFRNGIWGRLRLPELPDAEPAAKGTSLADAPLPPLVIP
ncbi:MAG: zinc dependent phospholipase C family protein [Myxococcaceae bacterium]|nr:zinc dependent phospholipase C family protein [Myxococcaceae bacterium]